LGNLIYYPGYQLITEFLQSFSAITSRQKKYFELVSVCVMSRSRNKSSKEGVRIRTQIKCLITKKIQSDNLLLLPIHQCDEGISLLLLAPLILLPHLLLLTGSKVVFNVEGFSDLLGCLALDHVGHGLACHIQQTLYIQIVSGKD